MATYVTGDIHGFLSVRRLSSGNWPEGNGLTRDDFVIILGDFGLVWDGSKSDEYWLDWLESKPWTTLFIDGNHENHRLIATYPDEEWHGGMVHRIRPHVIHLMRGHVFDIDGKSVLAMGGAKSHDIQYRTEGLSWWPEEIPSDEERLRCEDSLSENGWMVDYVLTHDVPSTLVNYMAYVTNRAPRIDEYESWLGGIQDMLDYGRWYAGHWHVNAVHESSNTVVLYDAIVRLGD